MVKFDEDKQKDKVETLLKKEEEGLVSILSARYGVPYIDLSGHSVNIDSLRIIKETDARAANIAIFNSTDKKIDVAVLSPENSATREAIEDLRRRGYIPEVFMASHQSLKKVWDRYKDLSFSSETKSGALDISGEEITELIKNVHTLEDTKKLIEQILSMNKAHRISKILEVILAGAIRLNASDIHFEPGEKDLRLRYRLDGVLTDILHFDSETFYLILSRIKLISELKLNTKEKAQDGRFSVKLADADIEIRVSLIPTPNGESVVMRILNPNVISIELESLGIYPRLLEIIKKEISKPNGMILTTGPTGSGKTTTLYAFLKKIYTPSIKVITIENPVEYHLEGIVQTQVDVEKGYTFAEGLKSALRQDPDVIMVGEIRDFDTATVAINAAWTGHLVFSTLHTNNAAGAFPRLIDLGINAKVISSAINLSLAQRLTRKLCKECKKEMPLEGENKEIIDRILENIADKTYLEGIQRDRIWVPVGCDKCGGLGFRGQVGLFEAILIDEKIENAVITNPSERDIREAAKDQKLLTLEEDGVIKVLEGITTLDEIDRVVGL